MKVLIVMERVMDYILLRSYHLSHNGIDDHSFKALVDPLDYGVDLSHLKKSKYVIH